MNVGSCFSNIGLLDYGLHLAGIETAWGCESDPWRRRLWEQRFRTYCHDDVRTLGPAHVGRVDIIAGGFPCKGTSTAGKQGGFGHPETVLWREMRRAVGELRPRYVLVENVANILALNDGAVWGEVLADLVTLGFDVEWDCLPAAAVGAPHRRDRVFAVATHAERGVHGPAGSGYLSGPTRAGEGEAPQRQRVRADAPDGSDAAADPSGVGERGTAGQAHTVAGGGNAREVALRRGPNAPTAPNAERGPDRPEVNRGQDERPRSAGSPGGTSGCIVGWGEYELAIRRWEAVHGSAPSPLVRRVDDRAAARVERSRLSALGDGVQVQVGAIVGSYILDRERMRKAA